MPWLIGGIAIIFRIVWTFSVPISEAPDEGAHFWVVEFLRIHLSFPAPADINDQPDIAYYGALPPFGYLPHLLIQTILFFINPLIAARFGSIMAGGFMLAAVWYAGKEIFIEKPLERLCLFATVAFHPQLVFMNCYVNNDSTACALSSWLIVLAIKFIKEGLSLKISIFSGLLLSWLLLSKFSSYGILPAFAIAILTGMFIHKQPVSTLIKNVAAILAFPCLLSAWWFARDAIVFADPTGIKTMLKVYLNHYQVKPQLYNWPIVNNPNWRFTVFISFWGLFGNMDRLMGSTLYRIYELIPAISLLGWLSNIVRNVLTQNIPKNTLPSFTSGKEGGLSDKESNHVQKWLWFTLLMFSLSQFLALLASSTSINANGAPQGRYLFPAEIANFALLIAGLSSLPSRGGRLLCVAFAVFNLIALFFSTKLVFDLYGFSTNAMR